MCGSVVQGAVAAGEEMELRVRIHVAGGSSGTADLLASVQVRSILIFIQFISALHVWRVGHTA